MYTKVKMKHLCVFLAFKHVEHVTASFDSLYHDEMDFFIVENHSENSEQISEFFKDKNIKGYIQFTENAVANAMDIFIKDYKELLLEYDYITFTDGDFYVYDVKSTFDEIREALDKDLCKISGVGLYHGNDYRYHPDDRAIGTDYYDEYMKTSTLSFGSVEGVTGNHLLTLKKEDLSFVEDIHFIDMNIYNRLIGLGYKWYKTNKNLGYHLTWDIYLDGNEYYEWKKQVVNTIWDKCSLEYKYKIIK